MNLLIGFILWVCAGAPSQSIPTEFQITETAFQKMSDEDKETWANSDAGKYWHTLHQSGNKYYEGGGTVIDVLGS